MIVPDPGPGEAVVDVPAGGSDTDEFPFLLGHEVAGVVSTVGQGVTDGSVGDVVVVTAMEAAHHARQPNPTTAGATAS